MTPEGRVKKMVTTYLNGIAEVFDKRGVKLYVHMEVPSGYGKRNALDYTICFAGHFVAIETKAPGQWLTAVQRLTARDLYLSGATIFIISNPEGLNALKSWVERHAHRLFAR